MLLTQTTYLVALSLLPCISAAAGETDHFEWLERFQNQWGIEFQLVPKGTYQIGYTGERTLSIMEDWAPPSSVELDSYYLSRHEVHRGAVKAWIDATGDLKGELPEFLPPLPPPHERPGNYVFPSSRRGFNDSSVGVEHPVSSLLQPEWVRYAEWVSKAEKLHYRLPTEEEWEVAARANTTTLFWWGDRGKSGIVANQMDTLGWMPWSQSPRGAYPGNGWGFYEVGGNVAETASGDYRPYNKEIQEHYDALREHYPAARGKPFPGWAIRRGDQVGATLITCSGFHRYHDRTRDDLRFGSGLRLLCEKGDALRAYLERKAKENTLAIIPVGGGETHPSAEKPIAPVKKTLTTHSVDLGDNLKMEFLEVPQGKAKVGSPKTQIGVGKFDSPVVEVDVAPFWLGKYEVTQAQYEAVYGENPSEFKHPEKPVEMVYYGMARLFCKKLTDREREAGRLEEGEEYRPPAKSSGKWHAAREAGVVTAAAIARRPSKNTPGLISVVAPAKWEKRNPTHGGFTIWKAMLLNTAQVLINSFTS